jgi:hypothetical protein
VAVHRGDLARLAVADARVVDDRVEAAERVDLVGDDAGLGRAAEVTDRDVRYPGAAARRSAARAVLRAWPTTW